MPGSVAAPYNFPNDHSSSVHAQSSGKAAVRPLTYRVLDSAGNPSNGANVSVTVKAAASNIAPGTEPSAPSIPPPSTPPPSGGGRRRWGWRAGVRIVVTGPSAYLQRATPAASARLPASRGGRENAAKPEVIRRPYRPRPCRACPPCIASSTDRCRETTRRGARAWRRRARPDRSEDGGPRGLRGNLVLAAQSV